MQKSDDFKQNGNRDKKNASFKQFGKRLADNLRDKDEKQVRERLKRFVDFVVLALTAYILSGAELFFGTYPLILAIMCSSRKKLVAVGVGSLITALMGKIPAIYIYVAVVILLIRMLATLLPFVFAGLGVTLKVGKEMIPYTDKGVELHLDDDVFDESFKKPRGTEAGQKFEDDEENILSVCMGKMFDEPLYVRVLCGLLGGIICGFLIMLERDFSFYSLYSMLALILLVPLAVVATSGILGDIEWGGERFFSFSLLTVMVCCIIGAEGKSLLGIPMIPFLTMLFTLCFSSGYGILRGTFAGAAFGAVMDLTYSPMFMISALLYSLISSVKKSAGIAAVCGVAVVWCYYLGGERGLIDILPAVLFAIPIFVLTDKYREMMNAPYDQSIKTVGNLYFAQSVTEKTKNDAAKERLAALDLAFTSLSETFYKLSDRFRRPDMLGIRKISDGCFEKTCEDCRNRQLCWGSEYARTMETIGCVNSALHMCGNVGEEDLPEEFRQRCIRVKKLVEEVNKTVNNTTESIIKSGKFKIFSANYDEITAILNDALDSDSDEYECDSDLGEKIFDYLRSCELDVSGAVIYGKRCRHIVAKCSNYSVDISAEKAEKIRRELVEIVGVELSEPIFEVGKDGMLILFYSRPVISASCSHGRISRNGCEWEEQTEDREYVDPFADNTENICGDITDAFITDTSYFYSLISDGMGSGSEAAYTSEVCAMFIQKMLMAGNRIDITLRMLNNVIRSENMGCGSECSATVDLFELDLMSGAASFVKSGAAPTYIARQGTVYKVSSRTMPVGIIKEADARITRFDTKKGDVIVMISDGCCHDSEDCPWLVEYLCDLSSGKKAIEAGQSVCESLKDEILKEAINNFPEGVEKDDISVSVIMVG